MGTHRMFSQKILSSAKFLKMPERVQMLYVQLGMNADDDGVVEAFTITRMVGGTEDDLRILEEKELIRILNDDLVVFILDWREHNSIRADK